MPEQAGAVDAAAAAPQVAAGSTEPQAASGPEAGAPSVAPDHEAPKPDTAKPDEPKVEAPKIESPRFDEPKMSAAKPDAEPQLGKLIVMSPSARSWDHEDTASRAKAEAKQDTGKRRLAAMAAVIALATIAGAFSGALATAGLMHFAANEAPAPPPSNGALEASVARIDADIVALKASLDHTSKVGVSQFNKTSDRLDKLEKAQAEPMARLAKLSDAVEKLRAAPPAASAQAAASKETTGSIPATQVAAAASAAAVAPAPPPKAEVGRLPTVEGWRLRDVINGGALIEGRSGLYEVYAGDPVPGLGRIDAIRKQDGRWVVVTSKGLIVAR
jgi:hypothetical protein